MTATELAEAISKVRGVLASKEQALVVAAARRHLATLEEGTLETFLEEGDE